ncbi:MAG: class I SAM-dependent methyltransferase, partial [Planctomycetota bacterium]
MNNLSEIGTGAKDRIVGLYSQARQLAIGRDYAQALELYDRIAAEVPQLVSKTHRINYERALCLKALGRTDEAEKAIRSCLDINPNDTESLRLLREVRSSKQQRPQTYVPGIIGKRQLGIRAVVIDMAMVAVLQCSTSGQFNALEVGCMFKGNEGLSTYRIADFVSRCNGIKQFVSIDYEPEHISACKNMLCEIDARLLSEVQFVCGYSLAKLAPILEKMGMVDFVVLDGGAEPACCLGEFELAASRLADNGLVVVDDLQDMKPTPAYPYPRPFGKATLILPCLVTAEYLKISNLKTGKRESYGPAIKDFDSEFVAHSSHCKLLGSLGELRYTIVSEGNHRLLVVG